MKEEIFEMYKRIPIGKNEICKECNKIVELVDPLSIYYVGKEFKSSDDTILFVGKTAVGGDIGELIDDSFIDATKFGEESLDLKEPNRDKELFMHIPMRL